MVKRWTLIFMSLALSAGLLAALPVSAAPSEKSRPTSYILPGDQVFPEGIAYQNSTGNFFVSSTTDGTIFRGDLDHATTNVFLPGGADGRTTAVGLKVDHKNKGRLFIAGGGLGKVFVYNTADGKLLASFSNNVTPTFINDVAIAPDGSVTLVRILPLSKVSASLILTICARLLRRTYSECPYSQSPSPAVTGSPSSVTSTTDFVLVSMRNSLPVLDWTTTRYLPLEVATMPLTLKPGW